MKTHRLYIQELEAKRKANEDAEIEEAQKKRDIEEAESQRQAEAEVLIKQAQLSLAISPRGSQVYPISS